MDLMPDKSSNLDAPRRRALYRAEHRGTKEMDWLLGRFARAELKGMDDSDLVAFEEFLALPEPDIEDWLLTPGFPAPEGVAGDFVARLKRFHDL
jgi:antitoxin CptB